MKKRFKIIQNGNVIINSVIYLHKVLEIEKIVVKAIEVGIGVSFDLEGKTISINADALKNLIFIYESVEKK